MFDGVELDSQLCHVVWDKTFSLFDSHFLQL